MGKHRSNASYLNKNDEAQAAIHAINWTDHPLGPPDDWPPSLRVALNTILNSNIPMFLFWGSDLYCFYNDAFIQSLKPENVHPEAMGKKAKKVWTKTWGSIKPSIERVWKHKVPVSYEDYLLPLNHKNVSLSPLKNEMGEVAGVLGIFKESTITVEAEKEMRQAYEEKKQLLEHITDGFYTLNDEWIITHWNRKAEKILNMKSVDVVGENLWDVFPEGKELKFYSEFKKAMNKRIPTSFEEFYEPWGKWFRFSAYPTREGISVYFQDITEQRRRQLINERTEEISGVAGWELDLTTKKVFMTPKAYDIYGLSKDHPVDLDLNKELFDEKSLHKIDEAIQRATNDREPYQIELNLRRKDGENRTVRINGFPLLREGKVTKLYGTLEDVTQEKEDQKKLEETVKKLKTAQKIGKIGYWTFDLVEETGDWSDELYNIWEVDPETFKPTVENLLASFHPEDRDLFPRDPEEAYPDQNYYETEHRIITPNGNTKWIRARITLHRDENGKPKLLEGISQDITEKKKQEEEILHTLKEKETLLEEVHHRVKNNLAVVSSMMQLQAYEEESDDVRRKLLDSVVRVFSMASIHEQLYQSNSFSKLDLSDSLKKVALKVIETMEYETMIDIDFDLNPIELNINQAIPCSLILNEVLTNIAKHAFPDRSHGRIRIELTKDDGLISFTIKDNGIGIPEDLAKRKNKTLGLRLIDTLAHQLDATYRYKSMDDGTSFFIQFKKSEAKGSRSAKI